jgi:hypothetical protein
MDDLETWKKLQIISFIKDRKYSYGMIVINFLFM